jgi:hypothetical protein
MPNPNTPNLSIRISFEQAIGSVSTVPSYVNGKYGMITLWTYRGAIALKEKQWAIGVSAACPTDRQQSL